MKTVKKFNLFKQPNQYESFIEISITKDAEVIACKAISNLPCIFAIVDPSIQENEMRKFMLFPTDGYDIEQTGLYAQYLDTVVLNHTLVYHVFEMITPEPVTEVEKQDTDLDTGNLSTEEITTEPVLDPTPSKKKKKNQNQN
jgi:hypothetical protein